MRKKHLKAIVENAKRGKLAWIFTTALNVLLTKASIMLRRPLNRPIYLGVVVNHRCQLSCAKCDIPMRRDSSSDPAAFETLLRQIEELKPTGIALTGGEPLLHRNFSELLSRFDSLQLPIFISTNGLILAEKAKCYPLFRENVASIAISFDSHLPERHDALRGKKGSFAQSLQGLRNLIEVRAELGSKLRIIVATVIGESANESIQPMIDFFIPMGVDSISINPRNPPPAEVLGHPYVLSRRDMSGLDSSRRFLSKASEFLGRGENPDLCRAPYFSMIVDLEGRVYPCYGQFFFHPDAGRSLSGQNLLEHWRSTRAEDDRRKLASCRQCMFSCMAEINQAFL